MINAHVQLPRPNNEPVLQYGPGSHERVALQRTLETMGREVTEIPLIINGRDVHTEHQLELRAPHAHQQRLARVHQANPDHVLEAIAASRAAAAEWARWPWHERSAVFLKAAALLASEQRAQINAATMLGQSKTPHQAEIDAVCELADFWRFNAWYATTLLAMQPSSASGTWNITDWRPLEGFVLALTPFNFTSICGNLPTAPAIAGNVVLWKPTHQATLACYHLMRLLQRAGLPDGVINFLPGSGRVLGPVALGHRELAGVHFTGSTETFHQIWSTVGQNIAGYRGFPRLVGETGGKDFIVAHASADREVLITALLRGAFEYQGQKCSAVSRAFIPQSLYEAIRDPLVAEIDAMAVGDPCDFRSFMGALIDRSAYDRVCGYIDQARSSADHQIVAGGDADDRQGYFVRPTMIEAHRPDSPLLREEIFGPVLTCFVYPDGAYEQALALCDEGSPYGLTGAVIADDRRAIQLAATRLRHTAGNFYINDKPTGAVVDQQPFGGARASGTNDKAGSPLNMLRWLTPRVIKETFVPARDYRYPYMEPVDEP